MPIVCQFKRRHGRLSCASDCPATSAEAGFFRYVRVEAPEQLPAANPRVVDVALLDMNHGWPNLGHDSLVHAVQDAACDLVASVAAGGISVRVLSFEVRGRHMLPEAPGERFGLYLGSGGPGHIDPARNDGTSEGSQGIRENPAWEAPLFRLFDAIRRHPEAALLSVCHSFGVMCRWTGVAEPRQRGPEKHGKSTGILENVLSPEGRAHPWFARFVPELPEGRRLRIADNRLFDLIPSGPFPDDVLPIGFETLGVGGPVGDALTMMEFARDAGGVVPRVFGVNHHPEIVDRTRQLMILDQKLERGDVSEEWAAERREILTRAYPDENSEERLHLTSDATLIGPLRFHLRRLVRGRARALGLEPTPSFDALTETVGGELVPAPGAE